MGKRTERRMNGQVENIMFPPSLDLRRQKKHHAQSVELDIIIIIIISLLHKSLEKTVIRM